MVGNFQGEEEDRCPHLQVIYVEMSKAPGVSTCSTKDVKQQQVEWVEIVG